jgi:NADH:ubiquinone oxidoreductase subunit E
MGPQIKLNEDKKALLFDAIERNRGQKGPLMPTLHEAQKIFGCIPIEVQKIIAEELKESVAKINGVVTFYGQFSIVPKGKTIISVCLGTACYVRGSQGLIDAFSDELNIKSGETSKDGKYTLEASRCIGACGLAPVFTVGEHVCGNASVQTAKEMILKVKEQNEN